MASQFVHDNLWEDLLKIDILGAKGCRFAPPRCNLLLEVTDRWLSDKDVLLGIQRFMPDGFGVEHFMADIMNVPTEHVLPETDQLIWDVNTTIPPTGQQVCPSGCLHPSQRWTNHPSVV